MNNFIRLLLTGLIGALLILSPACKTPQHEPVDPSTPAAALSRLVAGNQRFVHGKSRHPHQNHRRILETEGHQHPFAVVVTCSDSRVSPEIIFDEGLGDLFVIRTAGNLMSDLELGSIEYAVEHLGASLVVVIGHTECGAVKAFLEGGKTCGHITEIVKTLAEEQEELDILRYEGKNLQACIEGNILHGLTQIKNDAPVLTEQIEHGKLSVIPMLYDVHTGEVKLLQERELREKHHANH
ncbi:MAG: carbonic anhydrase [Saprospiraceae bacterium]|nr:carbonic anhydrase [Saprospiraceae bacterium]